jgi:hypothetical protein
MYKELWQYLGEIFHDLARQKECRIEERHLCADTCSHADLDFAEVFGFSSGGVHQGQECDCAELWSEAKELRGTAFLGTGLLCFNMWDERR